MDIKEFITKKCNIPKMASNEFMNIPLNMGTEKFIDEFDKGYDVYLQNPRQSLQSKTLVAMYQYVDTCCKKDTTPILLCRSQTMYRRMKHVVQVSDDARSKFKTSNNNNHEKLIIFIDDFEFISDETLNMLFYAILKKYTNRMEEMNINVSSLISMKQELIESSRTRFQKLFNFIEYLERELKINAQIYAVSVVNRFLTKKEVRDVNAIYRGKDRNSLLINLDEHHIFSNEELERLRIALLDDEDVYDAEVRRIRKK